MVQEAKDAGVWVFGGGIDESVPPVLELPSGEAALAWTAKIAVACRCAQGVRAFQFDPAS